MMVLLSKLAEDNSTRAEKALKTATAKAETSIQAQAVGNEVASQNGAQAQGDAQKAHSDAGTQTASTQDASDTAHTDADKTHSQTSQSNATLIVGFAATVLTLLFSRWDAIRKEKIAEKHRTEDRDEARNAADSHAAHIGEVRSLVDGSVTTLMKEELEARQAMLVLLRKVAGSNPSPEDLTVIGTIQNKIRDLENRIGDRIKQAEAASKQLSVDLAKVPDRT